MMYIVQLLQYLAQNMDTNPVLQTILGIIRNLSFDVSYIFSLSFLIRLFTLLIYISLSANQ